MVGGRLSVGWAPLPHTHNTTTNNNINNNNINNINNINKINIIIINASFGPCVTFCFALLSFRDFIWSTNTLREPR